MSLKQDSSQFADLQECIKHSKTNKVTLSNVSNRINIKGEVIIDDFHIFEKYETLLFPLLEEMELEEQYHYRPEHLAKRIYGTSDMWYFLLWFNGMSSMYEFNRKYIKYLPLKHLEVINRIIERHKDEIQHNNSSPPILPDLTLKKIVL